VLNDLLRTRESTHGKWDQQAHLAQMLKATMREGRNWESLNSGQREALEQIAMKISRILLGNPGDEDHWMDIAGYATLAILKDGHD
jgi:Domain of unknown function (DUF6378)